MRTGEFLYHLAADPTGCAGDDYTHNATLDPATSCSPAKIHTLIFSLFNTTAHACRILSGA
jgi:hypothetical protein